MRTGCIDSGGMAPEISLRRTLLTRVSAARRSVSSIARWRRLLVFRRSAATPRTKVSTPTRRSARRDCRGGGGVAFPAGEASITLWLLGGDRRITKSGAIGCVTAGWEFTPETVWLRLMDL